ncbi:MAG: hypothetical protein NT083_00920 [Rhodocyclales bacterium]|nr:hypothetical protein [Rhodocyclales bacterium]
MPVGLFFGQQGNQEQRQIGHRRLDRQQAPEAGLAAAQFGRGQHLVLRRLGQALLLPGVLAARHTVRQHLAIGRQQHFAVALIGAGQNQIAVKRLRRNQGDDHAVGRAAAENRHPQDEQAATVIEGNFRLLRRTGIHRRQRRTRLGVGQQAAGAVEEQQAAGHHAGGVGGVFHEAVGNALQAGIESVARRHAQIAIGQIGADFSQFGMPYRFGADQRHAVGHCGRAALAVGDEEGIRFPVHLHPCHDRVGEQRQRIQPEGDGGDRRHPLAQYSGCCRKSGGHAHFHLPPFLAKKPGK